MGLARTPPQRVSPLPRSPAPPTTSGQAIAPSASLAASTSTSTAAAVASPASAPTGSTRLSPAPPVAPLAQSSPIPPRPEAASPAPKRARVSVPAARAAAAVTGTGASDGDGDAANTTATTAGGNTTVTSAASPQRVFAPRRPGVMRTPPPGSQLTQSQSQSQSQAPAPAYSQGATQASVVPDIAVEEPSLSGIVPDASDRDMAIDGDGSVVDPANASVGEHDADVTREDDEMFIELQMSAGLSTAPMAHSHTTPSAPASAVRATIGSSTTPLRSPPNSLNALFASQTTTPLGPPPTSSAAPATPTPTSAQAPAPVVTNQSSPALVTRSAAAPAPTAADTTMSTQTPAHVLPASASAPAAAPTASSTAPAASSASAATTAAAPIEPRTPRRRSTRPAPAAPLSPTEPLEVPESARWGRRYALTIDTLEVASRASAMRWTTRDLEGCFPLICAEMPDVMRELQQDTGRRIREAILSKGKALLDENVGKALLRLDEAVAEARAHQEAGGGRRGDAWRPDLAPHAITAAANLGVYDETYDKLRAEYMGLHADCSARFASIRGKQAELAAFESSVSDGVVELQKSIDVMGDYPTMEMKGWAETNVSKYEGMRSL